MTEKPEMDAGFSENRGAETKAGHSEAGRAETKAGLSEAGRLEAIINSSDRKGGKVFPALCSVLGTLILLGVIAAFVPLTVPRLMGYGIYEVVSGSMEPEIPVGSILYVEETAPEDVEAGDVIAFMRNGSVVSHRVEENRYVEGEFITKGDANSEEDTVPVPYESLVGKAVYHLPVLGTLMSMLAGDVGKLYALAFAACGVMFHMLAAILKSRR